MKIYLTLFISLFPLLAISQQKMVIEGTIKNYPFDVIFIRGDVPDSEFFFDDTLKVVNGKFSYSKEIDGAVNYTFVAANMLSKFTVYLSNESITIEADYKSMRNPVIKGSTANDDYNRLIKSNSDLINRISELTNQGYETSDKEKKQIVNSELNSAKEKFIETITKDKSLKNNLAVPFFIYNNIDFTNYEFAKKSLSELSAAQRKTCYSKKMLTTLKQAKGSVINAKAYNFKLYDLDGKQYRLSDYKGQYVLLDFGASWCGWCKKEIPYIQQAYEYGKNKGLVVITVNLDKEKALWKKDSDVEWLTLSDLKAFDSPTTKGYNIGGIPQIFVIDKNGKIINRDLRGDDLVNYIKTIL